MTLKQAIKVLEKHNKWRTGNDFPTKGKMQSPKEITEAMEIAIHQLNQLIKPNKK